MVVPINQSTLFVISSEVEKSVGYMAKKEFHTSGQLMEAIRALVFKTRRARKSGENVNITPNIWSISKKTLSLQRRILGKFVINRKCETIWWIQLSSMRIKR